MPLLFRSPWLWVGLVALLISVGPLVLALVYSKWMGDENPNPLGCAVWAVITFLPSVLVFLAGLLSGVSKHLDARSAGRYKTRRSARDKARKADKG